MAVLLDRFYWNDLVIVSFRFERDRVSGASGRRFETEVDRVDSLIVLPDREGGELDGHAELHVIGRRFDVHDVRPDAGTATVDDGGDEGYVDSGSREGHDGKGANLALSRERDGLEFGSRAARAGVATIEEASAARRALVRDQVRFVAEDEVVDERDLIGQWNS